MPRVAIYARVSTQDQTTDPQLHALQQYAADRGLGVVDRYVDHGVSGSKGRRPELDRLLADARRRRFDAVACVKLDRLARSVRHLTTLAAAFEALGVDLVVLDQGIDTSTPTGRLLFHVIGAIAELEGDLIRERTRAGLAAARRRGKRLGRPSVTDRRKRARIHRLRASGHTVKGIAALVRVSRATVERVLASAR